MENGNDKRIKHVIWKTLKTEYLQHLEAYAVCD
jgi:hypothetical protein